LANFRLEFPIRKYVPQPRRTGLDRLLDEDLQVRSGEPPVGALAEPGSDRLHGPLGRPLVQIPAASPLHGLPHVVMEAQEVEAFGTLGKVHDPGLFGMQAQPERSKDRPRPLLGLFGPLTSRAQDHEVVGVTNERSQPIACCRPRLVEDREGDVCQQRGDRRAL
jgi:hypothetical protein